MSKLFVLSLGLDQYEIKDLLNGIQKICNNNLELKLEFKSDYHVPTLELFEKYIFKK
jgi:hypothetical protein